MLTDRDLPASPFTPGDLRERGVSRRQLDDAVRDRVVRRVVHGVYVRGDVEDSVELRLTCAARVISDHAVACDRFAAWLHGVDVFAYHEHEVMPPIETYVLRGHEPTRRDGWAGGTRDLQDVDLMRIGGVRATTPVRTAVDLACKLSPRDGLAALDAFMRQHGVRHGELRVLLQRFYRRRGVIQARRLVAWADPRSESPGESWVRYEMLSHELPTPALQHWVLIDGVPTFRLDLSYPRHRVVIEYDGEEFHTSDAQREADERRREWLRQHGWIVIVIDKNRLDPDSVDAWIAEIRAALRSRNYRPVRR